MSREIKFRGKCIDSGKWIYGGICINEKENQAFVIETNESGYMSIKEVNPESVGQFTGLKDKKGVQIYEGDIVKDIVVGLKTLVVFTEYANFGLKTEYIKDLEYDVIDPSWTQTTAEVIGNIHENPELLK